MLYVVLYAGISTVIRLGNYDYDLLLVLRSLCNKTIFTSTAVLDVSLACIEHALFVSFRSTIIYLHV